MRYVDAMLAEAALPASLDSLINNDDYLAEQKIDGHRCLMHIEGGRIAAVARSGSLLTVKPTVFEPFKQFLDTDTRWVFDGEYLNGCYYLFDLVEAGTLVGMNMGLGHRRSALEHFWAQWRPTSSSIELLPSARTTETKAALVERVREMGGEGVMFKRLDAAYRPGKRTTEILKLKFRNDIDCVVLALGVEGKKNMLLGLYNEVGDMVEVGECTALAGDGPRVREGDVVTVIYAYASHGGRLVQPTKPMLRRDKTPNECTVDQLIYVNKTVLL